MDNYRLQRNTHSESNLPDPTVEDLDELIDEYEAINSISPMDKPVPSTVTQRILVISRGQSSQSHNPFTAVDLGLDKTIVQLGQPAQNIL